MVIKMKTIKDFNELVKKVGFGPAVIVHNSRSKSKKVMQTISKQNQPLEQWLFVYKHCHERSNLSKLARQKLLDQANDYESLVSLFDIFPAKYLVEIFKKILDLDTTKQMENGFSHWEKMFSFCLVESNNPADIDTCLNHMCHYAKTFEQWGLILLLSNTSALSIYEDLALTSLKEFSPTAKSWIIFYNYCVDNDYYVNLSRILTFIASERLSFDDWTALLPLASDDDVRAVILEQLITLY